MRTAIKSILLAGIAASIGATSVIAAEGGGTADARRLRGPANAGPKQVVVIRGSATWEPISRLMEPRFEYVEPKIDLQIESPPLGSGAGIRKLIEGTCLLRGVAVATCDLNGDNVLDDGGGIDIAQSSRKVNAGEIAKATASGLDLIETQAAKDGVAIVVHPGNGVPQLSITQIQQIYLNAAADDWGLYGGTCPLPGRPIHLYTRNSDSGTYQTFRDLVIGTANEPAFQARVSANQMTVVDTALDGVADVANDPCGIFYAGIGDLSAGVRAVPVLGAVPPAVAPTFDTVQNQTYPLSRSLYLYTVDVPSVNDARGKLIDWFMSRSGQSVADEAGFVSAYSMSRISGAGPYGPTPVTDAILSEYPTP